MKKQAQVRRNHRPPTTAPQGPITGLDPEDEGLLQKLFALPPEPRRFCCAVIDLLIFTSSKGRGRKAPSRACLWLAIDTVKRGMSTIRLPSADEETISAAVRLTRAYLVKGASPRRAALLPS